MAQAKYYAEFTYGAGADAHTYRVYKDQLGYQEAQTYATSITGDRQKSYLVSPNSAAENSTILDKVTQWITPGSYPNDYIWTGGLNGGGTWRWTYNNETINRNAPTYNNWNAASYFEWFQQSIDPAAANREDFPRYAAFGLNTNPAEFQQAGDWYPKENTPYYYAVEIDNAFIPKYLNINPTGFDNNKDIVTNYSRASYNGGIRINSTGLGNFTEYTDWTFANANNPKKLKKLQKQDYDFVYYKKTGDLYYNENTDAKGWGAGGAFAQFENRPRLTSDQITLYTDLGPAI